jgi:molybdenum cofactor sulfurtransferase
MTTASYPYAPESMDAALTEFQRGWPAYEQTHALDELRASEYARLDALDQVYLDYTGGGLYAESQLREHLALLSGGVFGNPHSTNPTSLAATELDEHAREFVLDYFNASPDEYCVVFTQNASGALKLVGEAYPFAPGGQYLLTFDNHNSVNGIREYASAAGATVTYTPVMPPDMRLDGEMLSAHLAEADPDRHNLFAYPAQSNYSGVQHSLEWIARAQERGWDVLLDAAAFVPSNPLDLSQWRPDFVPISFYKMFGYPTGVGCLLARKAALAKLRRPWFAGGTITVVSVQDDKYYFAEGSQGFEDGTLNYLALPAVEIGLQHIQRIGIETIHTRVMCLTEWLLRELTALAHPNGKSLVRIYGPAECEMRGGTVTLNFYDRNGHFIDHRLVEERANAARISLRTGSFCNPGDSELALGIMAEDLTSCGAKLTLDDFGEFGDSTDDDASTGAVRISVGLVTTFADVYACVAFARTFLDKTVNKLLDEVR